MSKFWYGLIAGIMTGALIMFLMGRQMEDKAYARGYEKGTAEGTSAGVTQGIEQGKATQIRHTDSMAAAAKAAAAVVPHKKAPRPVKKFVDPNDINYDRSGARIVPAAEEEEEKK